MTQNAARRSESGFTLIELLATMMVGAILLTLSAGALRSFWLAQSLKGATDMVATELRKLQEDSVSQSHPLVFGMGLTAGAQYFVSYRFNPTDDTCQATLRPFDSGVFNAAVIVESISIVNDPAALEYTKCQTAEPADAIIFFYARGSSTGGSISLQQPNSGSERSISIAGITGRVTRT